MSLRWVAGKEESEKRVAAVQALRPGSVVHLAGICGTGMSAVASLLKQLGFQIQGSDKAFYPPMGDVVRGLTERIFEGYRAENLEPKPDLVVIGNNLRRDNPEVIRALELGIPYASMPEVFSALLIGDRVEGATSVVVSGTHGKTTTSGALTVVFEQAGWSPGYFIGGVPNDLKTPVRPASRAVPRERRVVVLEGDEYDSAYFAKWPKFHSYRPDLLVVTSLEFDHADIYNSVEEIQAEFEELVSSVPPEGRVFVSSELWELAAQWRKRSKAPVVCYGTAAGAEYQLAQREQTATGQRLTFDLCGERLTVETPLTGIHNALNLLVTAAVGHALHLSAAEIQRGILHFHGVLRRQSVVAERDGITLIEDFAHHPTAIQVTVDGIKERYAERRVVAVYEPRSNTARRDFYQAQYPESFRSADEVVMLEVASSEGYSSTAAQIVPLNVPQIIATVQEQGKPARSFSTVSEIERYLHETALPGDVILCMTNGDFGGLVGALKEWLTDGDAPQRGRAG